MNTEQTNIQSLEADADRINDEEEKKETPNFYEEIIRTTLIPDMLSSALLFIYIIIYTIKFPSINIS